MPITSFLFGKLSANVFGGETAAEARAIDWLSNDIKVMLTTSAYSPSDDIHEFKSDVTNEVTGTGYSAGGQSLTGKTLVYSGTSNRTTFDANDVVWGTSTITARYAVLYDNTPGLDSDKPLIGVVNFETDRSSSASDFRIEWNSLGIFRLSLG